MDSSSLRNSACPNCQAEAAPAATECTRCGVIFAKYKPIPRHPLSLVPRTETASSGRFSLLSQVVSQSLDVALTEESRADTMVLAGRAAVLIMLVIWGWSFITASIESNYVGESVMHLVNLPFHEAGHLFFTPLGRFMQVLGGSLGQLIMPVVCMGTFLFRQRQPFGASVTLWWLAESLMDLAPYINDARALDLMLLGGVTGKDVEDYHDWEYILRTLGWLQHDHMIALLAQRLGILLMLLACAWGAYLLFKQFKLRSQTGS